MWGSKGGRELLAKVGKSMSMKRETGGIKLVVYALFEGRAPTPISPLITPVMIHFAVDF